MRNKCADNGIEVISNHIFLNTGQLDILNWLIGASYRIPNLSPGILLYPPHFGSSLIHLSSPMTPETYAIPRPFPSTTGECITQLLYPVSVSNCGTLGYGYKLSTRRSGRKPILGFDNSPSANDLEGSTMVRNYPSLLCNPINCWPFNLASTRRGSCMKYVHFSFSKYRILEHNFRLLRLA